MFRTFMKQNRLKDIENRLVVAKGEELGVAEETLCIN